MIDYTIMDLRTRILCIHCASLAQRQKEKGNSCAIPSLISAIENCDLGLCFFGKASSFCSVCASPLFALSLSPLVFHFTHSFIILLLLT